MAGQGGDIVADVLEYDLRVVFCGTRPSAASALRRAYYAKPGNRFWPTLRDIGLTPTLFPPESYELLRPLRIGMTDLAKSTAGQDATMTKDDIDVPRLWESMRRYRPRILAFTSKTAATHALKAWRKRPIGYGPLPEPVEGIEVHVLPSTSGLATSYWDIAPWRELAARILEMDRHATA